MSRADDSGWVGMKMRDLYLGLFDGPHATPPPSDLGPVFLGIQNLSDDGHLDLSDVRHISEDDFPNWTKRAEPQPGDIVFTYEATLNRYAIIPKGFRGCLGRRLALIRPNPAAADTRFLFYSFFGPRWRATITRNTLAGATVDRIPIAKFPDFELAVPELRIQRRIGAILSAYDLLVENNTKRIKILEEMASSLYSEWFVNLRFPGHERTRVSKGTPQEWNRPSLQSVCSEDGIQTGPFGSQLHQSDYTESGVPVVMPKDLLGFRIACDTIARIDEAMADKLARHRMALGDTVYGRRGDIGRRAFISRRELGWLCGTGCLRIRPNPDAINPRFLFDTLGAPDTAGTIANRAHGATMPNLNATILKSLPILVPPRGLQDSYADAVNPMFEMIAVLVEKNENLRATRDLLLPRLISGEIDVSSLRLEVG